MKTQSIRDITTERLEYVRAGIESLKAQEAELIRCLERSTTGIESWLGFKFQSSCSRTPEYASFEHDFIKGLKIGIKGKLEFVSKSKGHFETSGFVKNPTTDKLAYWSISDVRFFPDTWYNNILVRTAKHDKDYTGGPNNAATWPTLTEKLIELTS